MRYQLETVGALFFCLRKKVDVEMWINASTVLCIAHFSHFKMFFLGVIWFFIFGRMGRIQMIQNRAPLI